MNLLELRRKLKKKKPKFVRQDVNKRKRLKDKWRYPKGRHSKMREKRRSRRKQPSIGYSSPKAVRGLSPKGLKTKLIHNFKELEQIKDEGIIISKKLGLKKKLEILKKIKEKDLKVLNIKNIDDYIKQNEEKLKKKKETKKEKEKKKEEEKKEEKKKEEEKKEEKKKEEKPKEKKEEKKKEEKEKKEKEEKRKILEQKTTRK